VRRHGHARRLRALESRLDGMEHTLGGLLEQDFVRESDVEHVRAQIGGQMMSLLGALRANAVGTTPLGGSLLPAPIAAHMESVLPGSAGGQGLYDAGDAVESEPFLVDGASLSQLSR
jgi:hypothetical protein